MIRYLLLYLSFWLFKFINFVSDNCFERQKLFFQELYVIETNPNFNNLCDIF